MSLIVDLIKSFNENNVSYCVFKEFDLIEKTLKGEEDIDILISSKDFSTAHNILVSKGYKKCKWRKMNDGIMFYIGYDSENGTPSLLHIHTKLRIGTKREKQLRWTALEKKILKEYSVDNPYSARVILPEDEICLLFIRMVLRKMPNEDDYRRLEELRDELDINNVYMSAVIREMVSSERIDLDRYINSTCFGEDYERKAIVNYLSRGLINRIQILRRIVYAKSVHPVLAIRKRLGFPEKQICHKGHIYAVVGVDGCGKSTLISSLKNDEYLKWIGISVIYGGNNNYWIPGLQRGKKGVLWGILRSFDRRMRVVWAVILTLKGKNVVFDRYFYDDCIGLLTRRKTKMNFLKRIYDFILHGWIGITPYKTFFLDIDPEIAYSRKQDYSYEKLCTNIENYRNYLVNRKEVIVVDATLQPEAVKKAVIEAISIDKSK
jgi:thymidylate kinase